MMTDDIRLIYLDSILLAYPVSGIYETVFRVGRTFAPLFEPA